MKPGARSFSVLKGEQAFRRRTGKCTKTSVSKWEVAGMDVGSFGVGGGWPWLCSAGFDQPGSGLITLALINKLRKHTGHDWAARVKKITGNLREAQDTHAFHSSVLSPKQSHTNTHSLETALSLQSSFKNTSKTLLSFPITLLFCFYVTFWTVTWLKLTHFGHVPTHTWAPAGHVRGLKKRGCTFASSFSFTRTHIPSCLCELQMKPDGLIYCQLAPAL